MFKRQLAIFQTVSRVLNVVLLLLLLLTQPRGTWSAPSVALVVLLAIGMIALIAVEYRKWMVTPLGIYVDLTYYLVVFVGVFSAIYWSYGTARNFGMPLTHLDAVYFTIGTLSTAGTGNIVATSELARALQSLQMLLDLGFLLIAVTLVIMRFSSLKSESKSS
jgi:voltage-gated potassium channel